MLSQSYPNVLVCGGTSGLGLALARILAKQTEGKVFVTGRHDPEEESLVYQHASLTGDPEHNLKGAFDRSEEWKKIGLFVHAAGFAQIGALDEIFPQGIVAMANVGLIAPALVLRYLLDTQGSLPGFIAITSTSSYTPREKEPMYCAVKAGLGMLASSASLDSRAGKVLVAAPAGMKTKFWRGDDRDTSGMLDPAWVAEKILELYSDSYRYRFAKILRDPARVEVVETR